MRTDKVYAIKGPIIAHIFSRKRKENFITEVFKKFKGFLKVYISCTPSVPKYKMFWLPHMLTRCGAK